MHAPGVEIRPIKQINGGSGFNEVFFNDVRVPDANRVGAVGDGWRVAITTLMNERVVDRRGRRRGPLPRAPARSRARRAATGGRRSRTRRCASSSPTSTCKLDGPQVHRLPHALGALARRDAGPEGSIGKAVGAPLRQEIAAFALELQGAMGAVARRESVRRRKALWQDGYLGSPGLRIAGGTDEILQNIIAERVLRLPPRDPRRQGQAVPRHPERVGQEVGSRLTGRAGLYAGAPARAPRSVGPGWGCSPLVGDPCSRRFLALRRDRMASRAPHGASRRRHPHPGPTHGSPSKKKKSVEVHANNVGSMAPYYAHQRTFPALHRSSASQRLLIEVTKLITSCFVGGRGKALIACQRCWRAPRLIFLF